ncbi:T-cell-specific guanine nucleotide triphosphate-binding protein 2-like [Mercenaria mercenaria]|uniref:T-cell-specific guanine nucleotide triphosphate-binding protein 2-like n=1 Tax=Mercenaria mercenaria TaxID=6596 RepID=UPI00234F3E1B|nr:T-cell-specific guanine nucleotide triphosphate-binding protein 2-like [Mercenaria mercenaria]
MAERYPDKGKVFKLTDSTGSKKTIVKYQHNYKEFSLKCKQKFGIPERETITFETEDGFEIDEESIPEFDNFSILVLRQQKASVCNEYTDEIGIASDEWSDPAVEDITAEYTDEIGIASDEWSDPAVEDITAGAKEIKRKLKEHGDENVEESVRSSIDEWKSSSLNICVIGSSGNGKSFLINVLRDVKDPKDKSYAKSGTTETTYECKDYPHPKYKNIIFWDVPGVGSPRFPKETYLSNIKVDRYDFFLICSCNRFKEHDSWLAEEIKKRQKRFYFLRTKVDQDIDCACREQGVEFLNRQNELATIRNYCESFLPDNAPCFLISSYHPTDYDFPLLLKRLVDDAPLEQKHAHVLGLCLSSKESIERKAKCLEGEIWKTAFLSGLGGAVPVPGISVVMDIVLICDTVNSYREHFKLTDEEINTFAVSTGLPPDLFREAAGLMLRPAMFTRSGIASLMASYAIESAVEETAIFVPVIGSAVAGTLSYIVTRRILKKILNACKNDALKVFNFVAARQTSIE